MRPRDLERLALPTLRKVLVGIVGASVVLVGIAMIVLPGPALVVIPLGLGILGTEFIWARRLLRRVRDQAGSAARKVFRNNKRDPTG